MAKSRPDCSIASGRGLGIWGMRSHVARCWAWGMEEEGPKAERRVDVTLLHSDMNESPVHRRVTKRVGLTAETRRSREQTAGRCTSAVGSLSTEDESVGSLGYGKADAWTGKTDETSTCKGGLFLAGGARAETLIGLSEFSRNAIAAAAIQGCRLVTIEPPRVTIHLCDRSCPALHLCCAVLATAIPLVLLLAAMTPILPPVSPSHPIAHHPALEASLPSALPQHPLLASTTCSRVQLLL